MGASAETIIDIESILSTCESLPLARSQMKKPKPIPPRPLAPDDALGPTRPLMEASNAHCRWPYAGLMICGRDVDAKGPPYCSAHRAKAYQPEAKAKD